MSPRTRLLVALASTALIGYIAVGSLLGRVLGDTRYGQLAVFNEVVRLVLDAYVEPFNLDRAMAGANLGEALRGMPFFPSLVPGMKEERLLDSRGTWITQEL